MHKGSGANELRGVVEGETRDDEQKERKGRQEETFLEPWADSDFLTPFISSFQN